MKQSIILVTFFILLNVTAHGQNALSKLNWFYGASIDNSSKQNQNILKTNSKIHQAYAQNTPILNNSDTNYFYSGRIGKDSLYSRFLIDSAMIISSVGENLGPAKRNYQGAIQMLIAEFYLTDPSIIDALFEMAKFEFGKNVPSENITSSVLISSEDEGKLFKVKHIDDKKEYHDISITMLRDKTTALLKLKIIESRSYR